MASAVLSKLPNLSKDAWLRIGFGVGVGVAIVSAAAVLWSRKGKRAADSLPLLSPFLSFGFHGLTRPLSGLETWYSARNVAQNMPHFLIVAHLTGTVWTEEQARRYCAEVIAGDLVLTSHPVSPNGSPSPSSSPSPASSDEIESSHPFPGHAQALFTIFDTDDPSHPAHWQRLFHPSYAPQDQGHIDVRYELRGSDKENDDTWKEVGLMQETLGFSYVAHPTYTLFRLVIVTRPSCPHWELILFSHHAVFDGRGALIFLRRLLERHQLEMRNPSLPKNSPVDTLSTLLVVNEDAVQVKRESSSVSFRSGAALASHRYAPNSSLTSGGVTSAHGSSPQRVALWTLPIENRVSTKPNALFLIKQLLNDRVSWLRPKVEAWVGPADRGSLLRPTAEVLYLKVEKDTWHALLTTARKYSTTINGALWSSAIFAMVKLWRHTHQAGKEEQTGPTPTWLSSSPKTLSLDTTIPLTFENAVDGRARANVETPDAMLAPYPFGSHFDIQANASKMTFWAIAQEVRQKIEAGIDDGLMTNGLIDYIPKPRVPWFFKREARKPNGRNVTMRLSNLGVIPFNQDYGVSRSASSDPEDGTLHVRDVWFARNGARDLQLFMINALTPGKDRDMNVVLGGVKELLQDTDMQLFAEYMLQALRKAASLGPQDFSFSDL